MSKYEVILTVCEKENISKSASKLNYSQSAVSQAIQSFEKELGVPLFKRSKAGVQVLPGAEDIVDCLRTIVNTEKKIHDIANAMKNLEQGCVRIGAVSSVATRWLPPLLTEFVAQYPNIRFELCIGSFYDLREMLKTDKIDFAFTSQMAAKDFDFISLMEDELMVILPLNHPYSSHASIPISWLKDQTFIIPYEGVDHEIAQIIKANDIGTENEQYVVKEDYATAIRLVEYGFGVSILPRLFLEDNNTKICARPLKERYYRTIGIAYPGKEKISFASKKFIGFAVEWLQQYMDSIYEIGSSTH